MTVQKQPKFMKATLYSLYNNIKTTSIFLKCFQTKYSFYLQKPVNEKDYPFFHAAVVHQFAFVNSVSKVYEIWEVG